MEADLAFRGIDLRDLYRPGGGASHLTPRRLLALIRGLPPPGPFGGGAALWAAIERAETEATKLTADRIRERAAHYDRGG